MKSLDDILQSFLQNILRYISCGAQEDDIGLSWTGIMYHKIYKDMYELSSETGVTEIKVLRFCYFFDNFKDQYWHKQPIISTITLYTAVIPSSCIIYIRIYSTIIPNISRYGGVRTKMVWLRTLLILWNIEYINILKVSS